MFVHSRPAWCLCALLLLCVLDASGAYNRTAALKKARDELKQITWEVPVKVAGVEKVGRPPNLPLQFQVKMLVDTWYPIKGMTKVLVLFHYDYVNQRTRQDLYRIDKETNKAKRYFTMIKRFDEGVVYMVMHRVKEGPLPNPAACLSVPTKGSIFHPSLLHYHGIYTGPSKVDVYLNLKGKKYQDLPTETWGLKYKKRWYKYFESPVSRKPVRLQWHNANATVVHLDEGPETVEPNIFDVRSVTAYLTLVKRAGNINKFFFDY
eukprot:g2756.t1